VTGLYTFGDIFTFPGGWKVGGIFIDAITGTVGTVFMLYGVFMLLGIMEASGVLEDIAKVLQAVVRGKRSAETMTALSVGLLGWVTGVTAVGMVAVGDVIKELGEKFGVDKYRRANLMDCGGLAMTALAPWTVHAVLPASLANGAAEVAITPLGVVTHNYYCIILLIIIAVTIITRIGAENKEK
jgi:Na+/H+ antiporter NhaC